MIVRQVDGKNVYDDELKEEETIETVVCDIQLEDLIHFQGIECEIIRGYYWDGLKDYTIQKVIEEIFQQRKVYKNEHNPLQEVMKLIMNSAYGKCIQRAIDRDWKFLHEGEELDKFWFKKNAKIIDDVLIDGSNIHAVRTSKAIDKHFNNSLLGIHILAMSKRIMNEVMYLAYDIGCHVYYQDTDSLHIDRDDLPILEKG